MPLSGEYAPGTAKWARRQAELNGQPGAIVRAPDGSITHVFELEIVDGLVQTLRSVINPDKLRDLVPVADVRALAAEQRGRSS
jgi:RNA polymerase sigma-70 factor (ECF subfamily)